MFNSLITFDLRDIHKKKKNDDVCKYIYMKE